MIKTDLIGKGSHRSPSKYRAVPYALSCLIVIYWSRKSHTLQSFQGRAKVGPSSQCLGECKGLLVSAIDM